MTFILIKLIVKNANFLKFKFNHFFYFILMYLNLKNPNSALITKYKEILSNIDIFHLFNFVTFILIKYIVKNENFVKFEFNLFFNIFTIFNFKII